MGVTEAGVQQGVVNDTCHGATAAGVQQGVVGIAEQGKCTDTNCEGGTHHSPEGTWSRSQIRHQAQPETLSFYIYSSHVQTLPINL